MCCYSILIQAIKRRNSSTALGRYSKKEGGYTRRERERERERERVRELGLARRCKDILDVIQGADRHEREAGMYLVLYKKDEMI